MTDHRLLRVSSVNQHGDPCDPCIAFCTCGFETVKADSLDKVGLLFDQHTDSEDAPRRKVPWR